MCNYAILTIVMYLNNLGTKAAEESEIDIMCSILAHMEFTYVVRQYDDHGVPFQTHLFVPEVHPDTGMMFLEREDEGHVLKVV